MINVQNIDFSYQKGEKVIDDLSFKVPENSIFGFLGANGSGKTTAIRILLNLCNPSRGEVSIRGKKISSKTVELYQNIGTLIEDPTIYGHLTGKENLKLWANYYQIDNYRIDEVLDLVGLLAVKDKKAKKYSLGMKQRLGIATSILHDPEILILDEPLNGLDPKGIAEIRNLFFKFQKEDKKTIFISSHILGEIENTCSDVCIIDHGKKLFSGKIEQLKTQVSQGDLYKINCDNPKQAASVLYSELGLRNIILEESTITMNIENKDIIPSCIKALVNENIQLFEFSKNESSLEALYLKLTKK